MKAIFALTFLLITLQNHCQKIGTSPISMAIDPYDYTLQILGVSQIEEYTIYNIKDSIKPQHEILQYVVNYDSLGRISNFKYDFALHSKKNYYTPIFSSGHKIPLLKDSSKVYYFVTSDSTIAYNYFEKSYIYGLNGLVSISIFNPIRIRGYLDGVYMESTLKKDICINRTFTADGRLSKVEHFIDDRLERTFEYNYQLFTNNGRSKYLINSVLTSNNHSISETRFKYSF